MVEDSDYEAKFAEALRTTFKERFGDLAELPPADAMVVVELVMLNLYREETRAAESKSYANFLGAKEALLDETTMINGGEAKQLAQKALQAGSDAGRLGALSDAINAKRIAIQFAGRDDLIGKSEGVSNFFFEKLFPSGINPNMASSARALATSVLSSVGK